MGSECGYYEFRKDATNLETQIKCLMYLFTSLEDFINNRKKGLKCFSASFFWGAHSCNSNSKPFILFFLIRL